MLGKALATQKSWHFHHFPIRKYMKIPCPPTKLDLENRYSLECNFPTLKLAGSMLVRDDGLVQKMTLNFRICHGPGLADPRERKCRVVGTCGEKRPCVLRWACPRGGDRVRKSLEGYGTNKHDMFYFNQQDYMCWSHMSHMSICIHT